MLIPVLFKRVRDFISSKLFKINDSAQKIALGVGLGIFSGLIPGTGPLAALFLAFIFKGNRAAALLGSLFTNTWLSFVTFALAIQAGSVILNRDWLGVQQKAQGLFKDFSWANLFKLSFLDVFLPVAIGYLIIGLFLGFLGYLITLLIIERGLHGSKTAH